MSNQKVNALLKKLESRSARIGIIGLGYVGLPLAIEFCQAGFFVDGYDVSEKKVELLSRGESDVDDVPSEAVRKNIDKGTFLPSTDPAIISNDDIILICVPTPLSRFKEPDMSYIEDAMGKILAHIGDGVLVILESTTYPGTTQELIGQKFLDAGFKIGEDVFVAFSPERVDPGNPRYHTGNTPKVVGGITQDCTNIACALYLTFLDKVIPVSSPATAEMVKLLENTFRSVNIALVNEMAMICERLGVDVWEVIEAASTKPFGFMPFYPGPGVGGHCIPIDPHYLAWKLKSLNFYAHFIELAGEVNYCMPSFVVQGVVKHLNRHNKQLNGSSVLILGVAYKPDISDVRESPALQVMKSLIHWGANIIYNDPYIPILRWGDGEIQSAELSEELLKSTDIVILITDHSEYDYEWILENANLIYDTRNGFAGLDDPEGKIARLGASSQTQE
ncbi:UDP-N-acetyl-D-glucosamine dehydrogenase [bacterium]|nr:MAG: UDP-N-acetyl-D-glucosamine dehydrogenase [bacterium]